MTEKEMIYHRKSCRSYTGKPVEPDTIRTIRSYQPKALYPHIRVHWEIVSRDKVKCLCPWTTPQLIAVYSEEADGYLENIGFLFQQMDLYLQTLGLGVCWLGLGRMNPKTTVQKEGMQFVILLAFGHPKEDPLRHSAGEFKRKPLEKIADSPDPRLEPARLAPSAVNSQPWYFTHQEDRLNIHCSRRGSRLDTGIALGHLYTANKESFRFFQAADVPAVSGFDYIGSFQL